MKLYETHSCGYRLKFAGPETVEAYEEIGGAGTCLRDAVRLAINAETLPAWQEAFAALLEERTGIAREIDQEATSQAQARSKTPETAKPIHERVKPYTKRVLAIWVNGDKSKQAQLQQWAQETADTISIVPAPLETESVKLPPLSKTEIAKANEILGHDSAYIEERITLMLSDIPDFPLARNPEGKPEPESLARLINRWLNKKLNL